MTEEHEQRLIRIVSYYTSRGRTEERDAIALELLYSLIADCEQHALDSLVAYMYTERKLS